jgi:hypothetical protein
MNAILVMVLATVSADAGDSAAPVSRVRPAFPVPAPPASAGGGFADMSNVSVERPAPTRWYGWELLLSDAAFVTVAWQSGWSGGGLMGGLIGVTLGTPLLHVANGNGRAGMRSIIVRSATWLAAGAAVFASEAFPSTSCHGDVCSTGPDPTVPLAILVAGAAFALVDDTALATVLTAPDPGRQVATARAFAPARFVPTVSPTTGGATMGLGGVF